VRRGVPANRITIAAFAVGTATMPLVMTGHPWIATTALWVSGALDVLDGTKARLTARSPRGTLMDITFDRLVELGVILGLALRYPWAQFPLLCLTAAIVFSITVFLTTGALAQRSSAKSFYYQAGIAERTEGFILFTAMMLWSHALVPLAYLFVVVETATGVQRFIEAYRLLER
jgi:phosphatidylglycerophosphate synthase